MNETTATNGGATGSQCFFKQIDEKNMTQEVSHMLWNPKMDLIAVSLSNGDIHLYRLTWQRVWSINNTHQGVSVTSMAWRPDGKGRYSTLVKNYSVSFFFFSHFKCDVLYIVLAVAFSNGHLRLVAVEDAKKIFSYNCHEPISHLYWLQESAELSNKHGSASFYDDLSASHLPRPISYDLISQLFDKANNRDFPDNLFIKESTHLTYLLCTHGTSIAVFVYGYFLLVDANLDLVPSYLNYKQLQACFLSDTTSLISTLGLTEENLLVYSLLDARILRENHVQIKMISTKFGMLFSMLQAIKSGIKEMEELWEDILVEMDQKFQLYALEKYSNGGKVNETTQTQTQTQTQTTQSNDSSLVNDFMLLYAFGSCSEHFKTFLVQELTEKGLKKLELSVENYYSNIQRLLNGNFHQ